MRRRTIVLRTAVVIGLVFASGGAAVDAKVLADGSAEQKQRKDIGKQGAKHALCMAKAAIECEENGADVLVECDLTDPVMSSVPDPDGTIKAKLAADLDRCSSRLNYARNSATGNSVADYTAIGCPGDSVPMQSDDPFVDLAAYQANLGAITRAQLEVFHTAFTVGGFCSDNQCTVDQAERAIRYARGLFKCVEKCENDYKDRKGNGGGDDLTTACAVGPGDANFAACATRAITRAEKEGALNLPARAVVEGFIDVVSDDLYNQDDCP